MRLPRPRSVETRRRPSCAQLPADSSVLAGRLVDRPGLLARLEALDDRIDALLLDLRAEVGAIAVDIADAVDHHVPGLPALRCRVHVVIDGHTVTAVALHLGAHGRGRLRRIDVAGKDLEAVGGEIGERRPVAGEQRGIEGIYEAVALLGGRGAPQLAEHEARRVFGIPMWQQVLVDELTDLGRVTPVGRTVLVEIIQHALGSRLYDLGRSWLGGR